MCNKNNKLIDSIMSKRSEFDELYSNSDPTDYIFIDEGNGYEIEKDDQRYPHIGDFSDPEDNWVGDYVPRVMTQEAVDAATAGPDDVKSLTTKGDADILEDGTIRFTKMVDVKIFYAERDDANDTKMYILELVENGESNFFRKM